MYPESFARLAGSCRPNLSAPALPWEAAGGPPPGLHDQSRTTVAANTTEAPPVVRSARQVVISSREPVLAAQIASPASSARLPMITEMGFLD